MNEEEITLKTVTLPTLAVVNKKAKAVVKEQEKDILVTIGCKFPNGVKVDLPNRTVVFKGVNDMPLHKQKVGVGYTEIYKSVWTQIVDGKDCKHLIDPGYLFEEK